MKRLPVTFQFTKDVELLGKRYTRGATIRTERKWTINALDNHSACKRIIVPAFADGHRFVEAPTAILKKVASDLRKSHRFEFKLNAKRDELIAALQGLDGLQTEMMKSYNLHTAEAEATEVVAKEAENAKGGE